MKKSVNYEKREKPTKKPRQVLSDLPREMFNPPGHSHQAQDLD